ncbi:MAG: hypothetical protein AABY22_00885 [Nanoarchaeota archaeon]
MSIFIMLVPLIKSETSFWQGDYFNTAETNQIIGAGRGIIGGGGGGGIEPAKNVTKQVINQIKLITKKLNSIKDITLILIALMLFYLTIILGNYSGRINISSFIQSTIIILVSLIALLYIATMKIKESINLTLNISLILIISFTIFLIFYRNYHLKKVKTITP